MAGLGRKVWTGETLSVADLQGYVQDQVVMVFANAAARSAAIPSGALAEGMLTYLRDTDSHEYYSGAAWLPVRALGIFGKMWRTAGFLSIGALGGQKVVMDTARVRGGVVYNDTDDSLSIPVDGYYRLVVRGYATGGSGYSAYYYLDRLRPSVANRAVASVSIAKTDTGDFTNTASDTIPLKAGDTIRMGAIYTVVQSYYGVDEATGVMASVEWVGPLLGATPL
jgi:hypothetical protein